MLAKLKTRVIGQSAENIAKAFLSKQGLQCIDQNFNSRHGEIDLIVEDKDQLVFVEVRYRKQSAFGRNIETVTKTKQQKMIKTARYYLQKKGWYEQMSCRFDVIGLSPQNMKPPSSGLQNDRQSDSQNGNQYHFKQHHITWIKNAFDCA